MSDPIGMFDNVRITETDATAAAGYALKQGMCYGFTTRSITGVEEGIGGNSDVVINVHFPDDDVPDAWFDPAVVQFVDHAPGTTIEGGSKTYRRRSDGSWVADADPEDDGA